MKNPSDKILNSSCSLIEYIEQSRKKRLTIVTTNGCFDILHRGHVDYLFKARKLGDILIIGLNSDSSVQEIKGPGRPLNSEQDRATVLASLEFVDGIYIFSESTPENFLTLVKPDIHVKGGDYKLEDLPERMVVENHGGKIILQPVVHDVSTTKLLKAIKNSDERY